MAGVAIAIVATGLLTATCDDAFFPADGLLPLGEWGGDNAGVIATDSLTHVHVGCTFGDIEAAPRTPWLSVWAAPWPSS